MTTTIGAICSDFYVNQKVGLTLDLPTARDTVLHMLDRVRKELPQMDRFLRYEEELALESHEHEARYQWLSLGKTSIRSGWVNPDSLESAYRLHRTVLELAPYYLSISPLDVEFVELLFGFDVETERNRHEVIYDALLADTPLGAVVDEQREPVLEAQPMIGFALTRAADVQAFVEVRARPKSGDGHGWGNAERGPISIYLTVRREGPFDSIADFVDSFGTMAGHAERLAEDRVIPNVVAAIRAAAV